MSNNSRTSWDGYKLNRLPSKRERIFKKDGYKCLKCGSTTDLTLDHIKPISKGGTSKMKNLQTLCKTCNQRKSDTQINYRNSLNLKG